MDNQHQQSNQFQQPQQPVNQEPNFQSFPPQEEPLQSRQSDKKLFIYVLIILVIAGGAFGFYVLKKGELLPILPTQSVSPIPTLTTTPDPTANWKTYRNEKYGFEVQHPTNINLVENGNEIILSHSIPYQNRGDCDMIGGTEKYDRLNDFKISLKISENKPELPYVDGQYQVGKLSGQWAYEGAEGCGYSTYHFPLENGKTLMVQRDSVQALSGISSSWNLEEILQIPEVISKQESDKLFNQILSTFIFIEPAWKTYQNNKYRYLIQYPANWSIDTNNAYNNLGFGGFTYTMEGPLKVSGNFSSGGTMFLRLKDNPDERGRDVLTFQIIKPDPVIKIEEFSPHEASLFDSSDKKEILTISGLPAVRYTDSNYVAGENINYSFGTTFIKDNKRGVVYLFTYFRPDLAPIISTFKLLESGDDFMCIQVITRAKDSKSGRIIDFPTPCDVPEGWVKI